MRLLYICSDFGVPVCGSKGASIHLRSITGALSDLGQEVVILSSNPNGDFDKPSVPVICPNLKRFKPLVRQIKNWLLERNLSGGVAREFRSLMFGLHVLEDLEETINEFKPDVVIERHSLFSHVGVDISEQFSIPLVLEVNAILSNEAAQYRSLHMGRLAAHIEQIAFSRADRVVAVSTSLAEQLAVRGVERSRIDVIPNGVDLNTFTELPSRQAVRQEFGLPEGCLVGFVGSLKPWHGVDTLVRAFDKLKNHEPSAHLVLVGAGPEECALRNMVDAVGLHDSVTFLGAVAHAKVPRLLQAMDVTVAPFQFSEEFYFSPIKLFEYMAAGTCVIASRIGQMASVIKENISGLMFRAGDVDDLASVLEQACNHPEMRCRLGQAAAETVRDHYTWRHAAIETVNSVKAAIYKRNQAPKLIEHNARLEQVS